LKIDVMEFKIVSYFKDHWRGFALGAGIGIVVLAIVFSLPLVPVVTETVKTEYVTELKHEPYTETEPYVTSGTSEKTRVIASGFYRVIPSGIEIPFVIDKSDSRLVGQFDNTIQGSFTVFDAASHIVWEALASKGTIDLPLSQGQYRARFRENLMWGEECYISLSIKWIEIEQLTSYREVMKYQQISINVPKYVKVSRVEQITVWQYLFD
jgi:hypothetical protein